MGDSAGHSVADNVKGREREAIADGEGRASGAQVDPCHCERLSRLGYRVHVRVAVKVAPADAFAIRTPAPASACRPNAIST